MDAAPEMTTHSDNHGNMTYNNVTNDLMGYDNRSGSQLAMPDSYDDIVYANKIIQLYIAPFIVCAGVTGNVISTAVLLRSALRKLSSSHYLAAIALVNALYLLLFLLTWVSKLGYNVYDRPIICQFVYFFNNTASFLCVWLPVSFCVDRYIAISWPTEASKMCTVMRTRLVVAMFITVGMVVYLNTTLTVGVVTNIRGQSMCRPLPLPFHSYNSIKVLDLVVNHMLPYAAILSLFLAMCWSVQRERKGLLHIQDEPSQIRATTFTFVCVYFIAHLPADLLRTSQTVKQMRDALWRPSVSEQFVGVLAQYLSHTGMACNLAVLLASYPLFRQYLRHSLHSLIRNIVRICLKCFCCFECEKERRRNGSGILSSEETSLKTKSPSLDINEVTTV